MRFVVSGESMMPDYHDGDYLLVFGTKKIRVGNDVVVCDPRDQSRLILKRIGGVKKNKIFLLGINNASSTDSRVFGWVDVGLIIGKVWFRYFPLFGRGKFWFW